MLIIETVSKSRGAVQFKNAIGVTTEKYQKEYLDKYAESRPNTGGSKSSNTSPRDGATSNDSIRDSSEKSNKNFALKNDSEGHTLEKGTMCKMARGKMVRWMAEQSVKAPEELAGFDCLGYCFCSEESDQTVLTFLRESKGAET